MGFDDSNFFFTDKISQIQRTLTSVERRDLGLHEYDFVCKKKKKLKKIVHFLLQFQKNQIFVKEFLTEKLKTRNFFKIKYFFILKKKAR